MALAAGSGETQLEALETKVRQFVAQVRKSQEAAEADNDRLRKQLADDEKTRGEVRRRMERLLKQIDSLSGE